MSYRNDQSKKSSTVFDQASTLVAAVELSRNSWLVAGVVPGISRATELWQRSIGAEQASGSFLQCDYEAKQARASTGVFILVTNSFGEVIINLCPRSTGKRPTRANMAVLATRRGSRKRGPSTRAGCLGSVRPAIPSRRFDDHR
jgi:hypothetical protein